jgi:hypothetical protein
MILDETQCVLDAADNFIRALPTGRLRVVIPDVGEIGARLR